MPQLSLYINFSDLHSIVEALSLSLFHAAASFSFAAK